MKQTSNLYWKLFKFPGEFALHRAASANWFMKMALAIASVAAGLAIRQTLALFLGGAELPIYTFFFPMVMLTAILAGFWPGIISTFFSTLVSAYILFTTPAGTQPEISSAEEVGLVFFMLSGLFISILAGLYRRYRENATLHEREAAVNEGRLLAATEWECTFNSISDPVAIIGADNRILRANMALASLQGLAVEQCIGQECCLIRKCDEQLLAENPFRLTLGDGKQHKADIRFDELNADYTIVTTPYADLNSELQAVILVAHDITIRKRQEKLVAIQQSQLKEMAFALQLSEETERFRIAGELHDQVGHTLLLAKMKLDSLANRLCSETDADEAEAVATLIEQSVHEIRTLTFQLRPPLLTTVGLEAALRQLCSQLMDDYGLDVNFQDDQSAKPLRFEHLTALYQASREILLNIVKHAKTSKAAMQTATEKGFAIVRVVDDGIGFQPDELHKRTSGYGLFNIRQRMQFLGGSYSCETAPGLGTSITISLPLELTEIAEV